MYPIWDCVSKMNIGDLVKMNFMASTEWQHFNGILGVIIDTDPKKESVFVVSHLGTEEIHITYLEVINKS